MVNGKETTILVFTGKPGIEGIGPEGEFLPVVHSLPGYEGKNVLVMFASQESLVQAEVEKILVKAQETAKDTLSAPLADVINQLLPEHLGLIISKMREQHEFNHAVDFMLSEQVSKNAYAREFSSVIAPLAAIIAKLSNPELSDQAKQTLYRELDSTLAATIFKYFRNLMTRF